MSTTLEGFGGAATLVPSDVKRLNTQLEAVRDIMLDGQFRTLAQLAAQTEARTGKKATEASVSARLRDLRKEKFGGYKVMRESAGDGLFKYQVISMAKVVGNFHVPEGPPLKMPEGALVSVKDNPYALLRPDGPANPIKFNVLGTLSGRASPPEAKEPVAGGRAAMSYLETLKPEAGN